MKRKFVLHLDALVVIALLFVLTLGMNYAQYRIYAELAAENRALQVQGLEDRFNLDSMQSYIDRLNNKQQLTSVVSSE
ncbi:MAG: hypothetical protein V7739_06235 [Motiliproteus sp.]